MLNILWQPAVDIKNWLPRLQSHRGFCQAGLPENTLQSIQMAAQLGYQMVEFDVRLTEDHQVILFHDDFISSHGKSRRIEEITLAELQQIVFVNQLHEILDWLSSQENLRLKLNIELKSSAILNPALERHVVQLIQRFKLQKQILISSFNPLALARIRFLDRTIYRALLLTFETSAQNKWYLKKMVFNLFCRPHALHLFHGNWHQHTYKQRFLKLNVPVVLWTYNGNLGELDFNEIHGIISDQITPQDFSNNKL